MRTQLEGVKKARVALSTPSVGTRQQCLQTACLTPPEPGRVLSIDFARVKPPVMPVVEPRASSLPPIMTATPVSSIPVSSIPVSSVPISLRPPAVPATVPGIMAVYKLGALAVTLLIIAIPPPPALIRESRPGQAQHEQQA
jgi:hypothetical protein